MNVTNRVVGLWMDSVYVAILEVTGNGVYKYDAELLIDVIDDKVADDKGINNA